MKHDLPHAERRRYHADMRRAMQEANQVTIRFNQAYFGSEHLLAGLLHGDAGVVALLLRDLGADPVRLKQAVLATLVPGVDMITGRVPRRPCAARAMDSAAALAAELGHPEVDTRHLLYGLASCAGPAAEVLAQASVTAAAVRARIGGPGRASSGSAGQGPAGNGAGPNG